MVVTERQQTQGKDVCLRQSFRSGRSPAASGSLDISRRTAAEARAMTLERSSCSGVGRRQRQSSIIDSSNGATIGSNRDRSSCSFKDQGNETLWTQML